MGSHAIVVEAENMELIAVIEAQADRTVRAIRQVARAGSGSGSD